MEWIGCTSYIALSFHHTCSFTAPYSKASHFSLPLFLGSHPIAWFLSSHMHMSNIDPSEFRKITQRLQQPLWICFMQKVPSQGPATSTANSTNSIKGMELAIIYPAPVQVQSAPWINPCELILFSNRPTRSLQWLKRSTATIKEYIDDLGTLQSVERTLANICVYVLEGGDKHQIKARVVVTILWQEETDAACGRAVRAFDFLPTHFLLLQIGGSQKSPGRL